MPDFSIMDLVVEKLCESMKNNPEEWVICTHTLNHKKSGIKYWIGTPNDMTEIWNGHSCEEVFSKEQGDKLYSSMLQMKEKKGSDTQNKIINSVCIQGKNTWWKKIFS